MRYNVQSDLVFGFQSRLTLTYTGVYSKRSRTLLEFELGPQSRPDQTRTYWINILL